MKFITISLISLAGLFYNPQTIYFRSYVSAQSAGLLTPGDFSVPKYLRMPTSGTDTSGASQGIATRTVSSHVHLFVMGHWQGDSNFVHIYEVDTNGLTPNTVKASAPRTTFYADWKIPLASFQSWGPSPTCTPLIGAMYQFYPVVAYWSESQQRLFVSYNPSYAGDFDYTLISVSLDNVSTGATTTTGGPWRIQATSQNGNYPGTTLKERNLYISTHPTTGQMIGSGGGYADPVHSWSINAYSGINLPTDATPGGCGSTLLSFTKEYMEGYQPGYGPNNFDPVDGTNTNPGVYGQFHWTPSQSNYSYIFQPHLNYEATRSDPASGVSTASAMDRFALVGWYKGTYKESLIYTATISAAASSTSTDCTTASHQAYLNNGQGSMVFSSYSGSLPADGALIIGSTSQTEATVVTTGYMASHKVMWWQQLDSRPADGETLTGLSSGATATVSSSSIPAPNYYSLVLSSVTGSFTTGEKIDFSTTRTFYVVDTWTPGTSTLLIRLAANFTGSETITSANGFSGTQTETHRNNIFAAPGNCACTSSDLCATGPSSTFQSPFLIGQDPADAIAVSTNAKADYNVTPTFIQNLYASPFSIDLVHGAPYGPALGSGGLFVGNTMYLNAVQNDCTRGSCPVFDETIIIVFDITDAPSPKPLAIEMEAHIPYLNLIDKAKQGIWPVSLLTLTFTLFSSRRMFKKL